MFCGQQNSTRFFIGMGVINEGWKLSINFPELTATCPKIKYINIYFLLCYYRQKFSRHPLYSVWFVQLNGFEEEQEDEEDVEGLRTCAVRADLVH